MRISDWSSDVCSSDLLGAVPGQQIERMQILDGLEVWSSNLLLRRKAFPYCRFARRRTGFIGQPNPRTVSEGIWSPIKVSICLGGLTGGLTGDRKSTRLNSSH